ncbi:ATP-binding protein [Adlercreutzia sp. ZJ138]|uniref:ATP-binding protein n=1 Tax=Adlercreutzia sp. ZJ138 TaxID=2709405 RepID=UPI0013ED1025|nr:SbcC/MukB-like Walker B domain-containing protein [Adlercreutzia sp. ZJ138]
MTPASEHEGQWRLARIDVANWGTFDGFHSLDVDRHGLLITGASGSGKSSLLDAIATVLTPPRKRHFNAAARTGSTKGEDRTLASYIRGAWRHETDATGEITNSYLRRGVAVWSGVLLRYESGFEEGHATSNAPTRLVGPINLLALFNLKAGCNTNDGVMQLFAIVRGDASLTEFERYAIHGIDAKKLRADIRERGQVFREHSAFSAAFCRQLGIAGTKTLELLHKTQAAKTFGSLDDLFRNFMLEEPQTFEQANEAVKQFTALSQAHAGVVSQRRQMEHLAPLVELDERNTTAQQRISHCGQLSDCLPAYLEHLALNLLRGQREKLQEAADQANESHRLAVAERSSAQQELSQAQKALDGVGGDAIDLARSHMLEYERQLNQVRDNRARLVSDLTCAGVKDIPRSYAEWKKLGRDMEKRADDAVAEQERNRDARFKSYGLVPQIKEQIANTEEELRHLRTRDTNIPKRLHQVRVDIADHLGVPPRDLPFFGELVAVKPEFAPWRGAIERLLGNRAVTLLVASRHVRTVSRYVESRNLHVRLEYVSVPQEVTVPKLTLTDSSLIRKLAVKQHHGYPPYSNWVAQELRRKFDYTCVDSVDDLEHHRFALTIGGQIKRENRFVKDDRYELNDRTRWVLGDSNEEKAEQYECRLRDLHARLAEASQIAESLTEQTRRAQDLQRAKTLLTNDAWGSYDIESAQAEYDKAREFYDVLKKSSARIERAVAVRDDAQKRLNAANDAEAQSRYEVTKTQERLKDNAEKIQEHTKRASTYPDVERAVASELLALFEKCNPAFGKDTDTLYVTSAAVQQRISSMKAQATRDEGETRASIERIIREYRQNWKTQAADLSESFEERAAYLGIYHRIRASGLPDYEQRFLRVLHDFSQDQLTVIASTIRGAYREVKEKLEPVNCSLALSPYGAGTHLQIKARRSAGSQVTAFLDTLQSITQGAWGEEDIASAEERFLRTNEVISRLGSSDYADVVWRNACLDTRKHVEFIASELDDDGNVVNVHSSDSGLSGGQKQKLVIFCLAAALRYQLADEDQPLPRFGTVILDEAFDKADPAFARTAMDIFEVFGFHMVLATPFKLITVLEPYVGAVAAVSCKDSRASSITLVDFERDADDVDDADDADDGGVGSANEKDTARKTSTRENAVTVKGARDGIV